MDCYKKIFCIYDLFSHSNSLIKLVVVVVDVILSLSYRLETDVWKGQAPDSSVGT